MPKPTSRRATHPKGELEPTLGAPVEDTKLDTFGGRVDVLWDPKAEVTALGPLVYFIQFLKTSGLWERWVEEFPLTYTSNNAPPKAGILGGILVTLLSGHKRYAHINALRHDPVIPPMLGLDEFPCEDSVRRAFQRGDHERYTLWMDQSLNRTFGPLLTEPWVLDIDATVKTLYGRQEEAKVGYNPTKPGRPSHVYHAYCIAALRMVLEVEVQAGNQTAPEFAHAGLFGWLDARPREQWPTLLRGDVAWGTEKTMAEAEKRDLPYLFKLRQSDGVKELMRRSVGRTAWAPAGGGWQGVEEVLQLQGWTRQRRVVVLRRALPQDVAMVDREMDGRQERLVGMVVMNPAKPMYEYAVLVTTAAVKDVLSVAQLYRDRADAENIFDEMKNQWGWSGFTTHDLARCQLMARINALVFNWWSLYTRLALPGKHTEATTSRPMLVYGLGKKTRHSQQTTLTVTSNHGRAKKIQAILTTVGGFLKRFARSAEQLSGKERWALLLKIILREFYPKRAGQTTGQTVNPALA